MLDLNVIEDEMRKRIPGVRVTTGYVKGNGKEEAWVRFSDPVLDNFVIYEVTRDNYVGDMKVIGSQRVRSDLRDGWTSTRVKRRR